jgi:hypothetical protein
MRHIAHHADDLPAKRLAEVHDQSLTHGVPAGEEPPRQSFVDQQSRLDRRRDRFR